MPASMSILPETLSNEDLQAGNGLMMSSMQGANLVGSAFAGVVVAAFTAGAGLAIDAATFFVSAASLALMRTAHRATPSKREAGESQEHPSASTQERGAQVSFWRFLLTSRLIQVILLMFIVIGLFSGGLIEVALPTLVHGPMHGGASSYGIILAAWGAGALVGSLFAGMLGKHTHKGLAILLAGLIVAASIALLPTWGVIGAMACIALAGVLSNQFGPAILFPFGGLLLGLVMVFGMTQRALREL